MGYGNGYCALKTAQRFPWIRVTDIDIKMRDFRGSHLPNFFKQANLLELEDKYTYDFIYCIDVSERIPNNIKVLRIFYQALKNTGYVYLHMPYNIEKKRIFRNKFFAEFSAWARKAHIGEQYGLDKIKSILDMRITIRLKMGSLGSLTTTTIDVLIRELASQALIRS